MAKTVWTGTAGDGDFTNNANWSGSAPTTGDDAYFEDNAVDVDAGLSQAAVILNTLNIAHSYTGKIGTTAAYLNIGCSGDVNIGYTNSNNKGTGSTRLKIDLDDTANTASIIYVHNTASTASEANKPPVRLKHNNSSGSLNVYNGFVGLAYEGNETSVVGSVHVGPNSNAKLDLKAGVTVTTLTVTAGTCNLSAGPAITTIRVNGGTLNKTGSGNTTTLDVDGGTVNFKGTGTITTANIDSGTAYLNSTGTITNLNVSAGGIADFTQSIDTRTVTNIFVYEDFTLKLNKDVVTVTNGIDFLRCGAEDGTLYLGDDYNLAISAV